MVKYNEPKVNSLKYSELEFKTKLYLVICYYMQCLVPSHWQNMYLFKRLVKYESEKVQIGSKRHNRS